MEADFLDDCITAINTADLKLLCNLLESSSPEVQTLIAQNVELMLLQAIEKNLPEMVGALLEHIKPEYIGEFTTREYADLLETALRDNKIDIAQTLIAKTPFPRLFNYGKDGKRMSEELFSQISSLFHQPELSREGLEFLLSWGLKPRHTHSSEQRSFVLSAVEADRPELVSGLLENQASGTEYLRTDDGGYTCAYVMAIQMGRLECVDLFRKKHRLPINSYCAPYCPALEALVFSKFLSEQEMIGVAEPLLEWGAHPLRQRRSRKSALSIAREKGLNKLAAYFEQNLSKFGPKHSRQARESGIKDLCLFYRKANGIIFRIADFDYPFLVGGDYSGAFETDAQAALEELTSLIERAAEDRLLEYGKYKWFLPFLERLVQRKEISFSAIMKHKADFQIHSESDTNNWD